MQKKKKIKLTKDEHEKKLLSFRAWKKKEEKIAMPKIQNKKR